MGKQNDKCGVLKHLCHAWCYDTQQGAYEHSWSTQLLKMRTLPHLGQVDNRLSGGCESAVFTYFVYLQNRFSAQTIYPDISANRACERILALNPFVLRYMWVNPSPSHTNRDDGFTDVLPYVLPVKNIAPICRFPISDWEISPIYWVNRLRFAPRSIPTSIYSRSSTLELMLPGGGRINLQVLAHLSWV